MHKLLGSILVLLLLSGCSDDDTVTEVPDEETSGIQVQSEFSTDESFIDGYVAKHGVEILYGQGILATRVSESDWQTDISGHFYVFGAEIIDSQHWVITVVRGINDPDSPIQFYFEETLNAGADWTSRALEIDSADPDFFSALAYDFSNNRLYVAVDLGLAVADLPVDEFNVVHMRDYPSGVARTLVLNPNRDELWWIGALALVSGGGQVNDALVKRYDLNAETSEPEDMTSAIGLTRVSGGMVSANNPNTVFISGREGIRRTEDAGANWTDVFSGGYAANIVQSADSDHIYSAHQIDHQVEIMCSQDFGDNWTTSLIALPEGADGLMLFDISEDRLVLGFNHQRIYSVSLNDVDCS